jgi:hypothetical protein
MDFVFKFKHLESMLGKRMDLIGVPEAQWGKIREEFLNDHQQESEGFENLFKIRTDSVIVFCNHFTMDFVFKFKHKCLLSFDWRSGSTMG